MSKSCSNWSLRGLLAAATFIVLQACLWAQWTGAPRMRVHIIDVGQASATIVEFKCGAILIDAGSGFDGAAQRLRDYLKKFFHRRSDLSNTFEAVYLTHCHIDHDQDMLEVLQTYTVKRLVFDGKESGSGASKWKKIKDFCAQHGNSPKLIEVWDEAARSFPGGITNSDIDPLSCDDCDPEIHILAGGIMDNPGWPQSEFDNPNNNSLVIRIDLGGASLLITGDMEKRALDRLVPFYQSRHSLDTDLLVVGHHGSDNGVTNAFLQAVTPKKAFISCGEPDDPGYNPQFRTWEYGHPKISTLDLLQQILPGSRKTITVKAAVKKHVFQNYVLKKPIYCTSWDGNILAEETPAGKITVKRLQ